MGGGCVALPKREREREEREEMRVNCLYYLML